MLTVAPGKLNSTPRPLDPDLPELESLTGLDWEVLANRPALLGSERRRVVQSVMSPGDQAGESDPAVGVGERTLKAASGLVVGQALEVTKNDRCAEVAGQPLDFVMKNLGVLSALLILIRLGRGYQACLVKWAETRRSVFILNLIPEPNRSLGNRFSRNAQGDAEEPVAEEVGIPKNGGFSSQDEEDRLEGILSQMEIVNVLPADGEHHGAMPLYERREGGFGRRVTAGWEGFKQLSVRPSRVGPALEKALDLAHGRSFHSLGHRQLSLLRFTGFPLSTSWIRGRQSPELTPKAEKKRRTWGKSLHF
jgi:hypothetical protein